MRTEQTIEGIRARLLADRAVGKRVALVPTMGALHAGHLALVDAARAAADTVVVSVFVNPLQFGPQEDFARYPRTLAQDVAALEARGVTLLFAPLVEEMYRPGERTIVTPPPYADMYEGAVRPGHFAGVLTVVAKLFNIVRPDAAVFGRKDLQQLALIRGMQHELNFPVDIIPVETVRDADGLALSSRNRYLSSEDRVRARQLRAALRTAKSAHDAGTGASMDVAAAGRGALARDGAMDIDYFAVVRETDFSTPAVAGPGDAVIAAIRLGGTRLIDNILL